MTGAIGDGTAPPILLFNGECSVCRVIARWVHASARTSTGAPTLVDRPIGDDPAALRALNPALDIWDAYATIHLLMPDGSMRTGGAAVAEVLRRLPNCRWFAWTFAVRLFGFAPFALVLDAGYTVLADIRPLLGCESCGIPSPFVAGVHTMLRFLTRRPTRVPATAGSHFTPAPLQAKTSA